MGSLLGDEQTIYVKKCLKAIKMQSVNMAEIEIVSELLGIQAWNNSWKEESHLGLCKCHIALHGLRTLE